MRRSKVNFRGRKKRSFPKSGWAGFMSRLGSSGMTAEGTIRHSDEAEPSQFVPTSRSSHWSRCAAPVLGERTDRDSVEFEVAWKVNADRHQIGRSVYRVEINKILERSQSKTRRSIGDPPPRWS